MKKAYSSLYQLTDGQLILKRFIICGIYPISQYVKLEVTNFCLFSVLRTANRFYMKLVVELIN